MVTAAPGVCAVCGHRATVADWTPIRPWLAVEDCPCGGFFVWKTLWETRLPGMTEAERQDLAERIRDRRSKGWEVWITTRDAAVEGPLVFSSAMPPPAVKDQPRS